MTEQEKILEEIKRNLGEERLDEILDSMRSFFSGPGRGARPVPQKVDTNAAMAASDPKPDASTANRAALDSSGVATRSVQPSTDASPAAPATSSAPTPAQTQRPGSIRAGLNRAGLGTDQSGVVGGATPADRARPATAAPATSSFAPANVAKQQQANRASADDRDAADMASQASNRAAPAAAPAAAPPAASEPRDPGTGEKLSSAQDLNRLSNNAQRDPGTGELKSDAKDLSTMSRTQSATRPAPRQAAPAASSAPDQPSRSSQMFQAASNKGDDATSADFFRADRQAQSERKSAPAAPQKPQQSNADYMKSSGMMDEANLERKIRKMFEQKSAKFTGGGADIQDLSGPNKPVGKSEKEQHHGVAEENIQEISGTATGFGGRHNPKRSQAKSTLGGNKMKTRASLQRSGNQKAAGRYEEYTISEARKAAFKKVEKMKGSRTDTGSPADPIDTEPSKPSMTGY